MYSTMSTSEAVPLRLPLFRSWFCEGGPCRCCRCSQLSWEGVCNHRCGPEIWGGSISPTPSPTPPPTPGDILFSSSYRSSSPYYSYSSYPSSLAVYAIIFRGAMMMIIIIVMTMIVRMTSPLPRILHVGSVCMQVFIWKGPICLRTLWRVIRYNDVRVGGCIPPHQGFPGL